MTMQLNIEIHGLKKKKEKEATSTQIQLLYNWKLTKVCEKLKSIYILTLAHALFSYVCQTHTHRIPSIIFHKLHLTGFSTTALFLSTFSPISLFFFPLLWFHLPTFTCHSPDLINLQPIGQSHISWSAHSWAYIQAKINAEKWVLEPIQWVEFYGFPLPHPIIHDIQGQTIKCKTFTTTIAIKSRSFGYERLERKGKEIEGRKWKIPSLARYFLSCKKPTNINVISFKSIEALYKLVAIQLYFGLEHLLS